MQHNNAFKYALFTRRDGFAAPGLDVIQQK